MCKHGFLKLLVLQEGGHGERKRIGLFEFCCRKISTFEIEIWGAKEDKKNTLRSNLDYLCGISDFWAGGKENLREKPAKLQTTFLNIWRKPNICFKSHFASCRRGKFKIPLKFPQIITDFLGLPS